MNIVKYIKDVLGGRTSGGQQDYTDVLNKLREIEKSSDSLPEKPTLPEAGSYERMQYDAPTDDEIRSGAENSLAEYRSNSLGSIESEMSALAEKYASDKRRNDESYSATLRSIADAYDAAVESAGDDALRRGLARSSIAANTTAALRGEQAKKNAEAGAAYSEASREIDEKLAGLEDEKRKALDSFNVSYTAKLNEQIEKLRAERDRLQEEALKYNNSLTEKENKERLDRAKAESDLYGEALSHAKAERDLTENLTAAQREQRYRDVYALLRDKLASMTAVDAQNEVRTNPIFRDFLSEAYYYKLYDEFGR